MLALYRFYLCIIGILFVAPSIQAVSRWQGEYLRPNEGIMRVELMPVGPSRGSVRLTVFNHRTRKSYQIVQRPVQSFLRNSIWKLPSGRYTIRTLSFIDRRGRMHRKRMNRTFFVPPLSLSNLGRWQIRSTKRRGIHIRINMIQVEQIKRNILKMGAIKSILDGFTRKIQYKNQRGPSIGWSKTSYSKKNELRRVFSYTRKVHVSYQLQLARRHQQSIQIVRAIRFNDHSIRRCLTEHSAASVSGQATFRFILSKKNHGFADLRYVGPRKKNHRNHFLRCLSLSLQAMDLPVQSPMRGEMKLFFKVR